LSIMVMSLILPLPQSVFALGCRRGRGLVMRLRMIFLSWGSHLSACMFSMTSRSCRVKRAYLIMANAPSGWWYFRK
jgi:hypothetical protein